MSATAKRYSTGKKARDLRVWSALVVMAAVAWLSAGCGSTGTASSSQPATGSTGTGTGTGSAASATASRRAAAGTLTGAPAAALANQAIAGTEAAGSVRVSGHNVGTGTGGQHVTFDLTLVKNVGCAGVISLSAAETFKIINAGGYVWLLPNSAFYASQHISQSVQALLAGKYIKVKADDRQIASLSQICTFSSLFGKLSRASGTGYTATPVTYHGQPAYRITQAGQSGTVIVSNTAQPLLLLISDPQSSGGIITFTNYNTVTTITVPTAAETVDGTKLGI
jgi:hypothetical protein